jgi:hypothetical protein
MTADAGTDEPAGGHMDGDGMLTDDRDRRYLRHGAEGSGRAEEVRGHGIIGPDGFREPRAMPAPWSSPGVSGRSDAGRGRPRPCSEAGGDAEPDGHRETSVMPESSSYADGKREGSCES